MWLELSWLLIKSCVCYWVIGNSCISLYKVVAKALVLHPYIDSLIKQARDVTPSQVVVVQVLVYRVVLW